MVSLVMRRSLKERQRPASVPPLLPQPSRRGAAVPAWQPETASGPGRGPAREAPQHPEAGDALVFHCRIFHAAGRDASGEAKLSTDFRCHASGNRPIPGTRPDRYPSVPL